MTTPALPVLYSFRRCPYAIRARVALRYAGVPVTMQEIALGNKSADFVALTGVQAWLESALFVAVMKKSPKGPP